MNININIHFDFATGTEPVFHCFSPPGSIFVYCEVRTFYILRVYGLRSTVYAGYRYVFSFEEQ